MLDGPDGVAGSVELHDLPGAWRKQNLAERIDGDAIADHDRFAPPSREDEHGSLTRLLR